MVTYPYVLTSWHRVRRIKWDTARISSWSGDVGADEGVSTTNYLWPSKLSFYCSSPHRKPGLLCYCWMREKEWESWTKTVCVHVHAWVCVCILCDLSVCMNLIIVWVVFNVVCVLIWRVCHKCVYWSVGCVSQPEEAISTLYLSQNGRGA